MLSDLNSGEEQSPVVGGKTDRTLFGDWQRPASLLVALAYLVVTPFLYPEETWAHVTADLLITLLCLAFPLACIWFAEDLAEYYRDGNLVPEITTPSNSSFVKLGGWILLLLPILLFLLMRVLDSLYG